MPTVLNVHPRETARAASAAALRQGSFQVLEASTADEALRLAERLPEVMVLSDGLPDLSGAELFRRLKNQPRTSGIKILMVSGSTLGTEGDAFLVEPFEPQQLLALVHSLLRLSQAESRLKAQTGEFLAMLGHELRNPLAVMSASLPVLRRESMGQVGQRSLDAVERQTEHLRQLVNDLLDGARVTHGKIELRKETLNLTTLLSHVAEAAQALGFGRRNQQFIARLPEAPLYVEGDAARLEQIFANLLDNASKYTDRGGSIALSAESVGQGPSAHARIVVKDTGIGISPSALSAIFGLFAQSDVTLDRARGGLGIGLTIVKRLVELHDGQVAARSDGPGAGSEFEVRLPLRAAPVAESHAPQREGAFEAMGIGREVVIIEDNSDLQQSLADLCELWGHRVRSASDGLAGVDVILQRPADICLIDIGLPGIDGYEVARRVRRGSPGQHRPVLVALTGYGAADERRQAMEAGFDFHLVKPPDTEELEHLLRNLSLPQNHAPESLSRRP